MLTVKQHTTQRIRTPNYSHTTEDRDCLGEAIIMHRFANKVVGMPEKNAELEANYSIAACPVQCFLHYLQLNCIIKCNQPAHIRICCGLLSAQATNQCVCASNALQYTACTQNTNSSERSL